MTDTDHIAEARAATWADASATLNDHANIWEQDGTDPCRVRICREMANAFRTYAEGVGLPAIDSLRQKRKDAEAEVATLTARLAAVEALADKWEREVDESNPLSPLGRALLMHAPDDLRAALGVQL